MAAAEKMASERERQRSLRAAQEGAAAAEYFARMQRLVLTDKPKKEK
jgi:hypothetical protein